MWVLQREQRVAAGEAGLQGLDHRAQVSGATRVAAVCAILGFSHPVPPTQAHRPPPPGWFGAVALFTVSPSLQETSPTPTPLLLPK